MASLVLLVSEFLHPQNTQILYTYHSSSVSNLQKKNSKSRSNYNNNGEDLKQVKDQADLNVDDDDLPHLSIDSQLVWP
ncbi:unnamed protein product [Amaranthus hypochondriacus]